MKSVGSCFPNCQRFLLPHQGILIHLSHSEMGSHLKIDPPPCSLPSSFFSSSLTSLAAVALYRTPVEMGVTAESQFHVLAVDDSLIDRKLIERLLKTSSYQVTAVDSGSKALEFLGLNAEQPRNSHTTSVSPNYHNQEIEVNLIITDYFMPEMTGYDLLRKIKESKSYKDVPVVIMSSENVPSRISQCLEDGAEEFFLKPVQLSDVNKLRPHLLRGKSKEQHPNSEKRKDREEILSPERTRTRYDVPEVF